MSNILKFSLLSTVLLFNNCYSTEEDYKLPYEVEPQYYNNNPNINQSTEQSYNNNFNIKQNDSSTPEIANENNPEIEKSMLKQDELSIPPGFKMDDITYFKSINSQILKNLCDKNLTKIMNEDILNKDKFFNKLDAAINSIALTKYYYNTYGKDYLHRGLENFVSNCFVNCVLQIFASCPELLLKIFDQVKQKYYKLFQTKDGVITLEFVNVMAELFKGIENQENLKDKEAYIKPTSFMNILQKCKDDIAWTESGGNAYIIFQSLVALLHNALNLVNNNDDNNTANNVDSTNYSKVLEQYSEDFSKQYKSSISDEMYLHEVTGDTCDNCKKTGYSIMSNHTLFLKLQTGMNVNKKKMTADKTVSLEDCLSAFEMPLSLGEVLCKKCSNWSETSRIQKLECLPNILSICIDDRLNFDAKLSAPEYIDLSNFVNTPSPDGDQYYLAACVMFFGQNNQGHYIIFTRSAPGARWLRCNDAMVDFEDSSKMKKCLTGENNNCKPYILIYKKMKDYTPMVKLVNKYQKTPKFGKNTNNNNNINNTNQNYNNINNNAYTNNNYNNNTNNFMGTNMNNGNVMGMYNMNSMYNMNNMSNANNAMHMNNMSNANNAMVTNMNNSNAMGVGNMQMGNMNTNNNMNYMTNNNSMGWNNNWNNNMYNNMNYNNQNMSYQNMSNMNNY